MVAARGMQRKSCAPGRWSAARVLHPAGPSSSLQRPGSSPNPEPDLGIWGRPLGGRRLRWAKRLPLLFTERLRTETAGCAGEAEFPGSGTTSVWEAIDRTRKGAQRCLSEPRRPPTGSPRAPCLTERHGTGGTSRAGAGRGLRSAALRSTRDRLFNRQLLASAKAGEAVTRAHLLGWFLHALKGISECSFGWKCASGDTEADLLAPFPGMPGVEGRAKKPDIYKPV